MPRFLRFDGLSRFFNRKPVVATRIVPKEAETATMLLGILKTTLKA
jgi:hypothetical protein